MYILIAMTLRFRLLGGQSNTTVLLVLLTTSIYYQEMSHDKTLSITASLGYINSTLLVRSLGVLERARMVCNIRLR